MKSYMFPLTFLGGALGWETLKSVLIPMIVWSGTAAGGAMYVKWVIKSHNANVLRLEGATSGRLPAAERQVGQFVDDLSAMVMSRDTFIWTFRADDPNVAAKSAKISAMRAEDTRILAEANQLQVQSDSAYTNDISNKVEQLRRLDDQLKILGDQTAARLRSSHADVIPKTANTPGALLPK